MVMANHASVDTYPTNEADEEAVRTFKRWLPGEFSHRVQLSRSFSERTVSIWTNSITLKYRGRSSSGSPTKANYWAYKPKTWHDLNHHHRENLKNQYTPAVLIFPGRLRMSSCFFMKYLLAHTAQMIPIPQTTDHGDAWRILSLVHSTALVPPLPINLFLTTLLYRTMCSTDTHFTLPHAPNYWPPSPVTIFRYTPSMLSTHLFTH